MKNSIAALILTKDRPMQFHCCLNSLGLNLPEIKNIYVLLHKATKDYHDVIHEMSLKYELGIRFNSESKTFKEELVGILKEIGETYEHVLLLTDDTIVYRKCDNITPLIFPFFNDTSVFTVSLRLGKNTTNQNPDDCYDKITIPFDFTAGSMAYWNWRKESISKNTGYPISMDGHIYRTAQITEMTELINFQNLREWEGELIGAVHADIFKTVHWNYSTMCCPEESICVNVNTNMVQYPFNIKCGPYSQTAGSLLDKFRAGHRINLEKTLDGVTINGSHVNFPLKMEKVK